eukprot:CAMPEP_0175050606 /NCGR_PEP_ID=MMETSP0052_2-20121109/7348_1 /TAXON_ID=51329 ORGANISM="Polytomella parva, Strain SAG 63-3" /NCGR_SAMPLE_ID=MMETSP0052_2 /ASSEMBLY_ACC=CAM_ASM_000194 /LENGTH=585 /DNA_ID=CAMNT_0016314819 /DNA_START=35 /DNA_END=1789 /DNA_ORIENTATION=+
MTDESCDQMEITRRKSDEIMEEEEMDEEEKERGGKGKGKDEKRDKGKESAFTTNNSRGGLLSNNNSSNNAKINTAPSFKDEQPLLGKPMTAISHDITNKGNHNSISNGPSAGSSPSLAVIHPLQRMSVFGNLLMTREIGLEDFREFLKARKNEYEIPAAGNSAFTRGEMEAEVEMGEREGRDKEERNEEKSEKGKEKNIEEKETESLLRRESKGGKDDDDKKGKSSSDRKRVADMESMMVCDLDKNSEECLVDQTRFTQTVTLLFDPISKCLLDPKTGVQYQPLKALVGHGCRKTFDSSRCQDCNNGEGQSKPVSFANSGDRYSSVTEDHGSGVRRNSGDNITKMSGNDTSKDTSNNPANLSKTSTENTPYASPPPPPPSDDLTKRAQEGRGGEGRGEELKGLSSPLPMVHIKQEREKDDDNDNNDNNDNDVEMRDMRDSCGSVRPEDGGDEEKGQNNSSDKMGYLLLLSSGLNEKSGEMERDQQIQDPKESLKNADKLATGAEGRSYLRRVDEMDKADDSCHPNRDDNSNFDQTNVNQHNDNSKSNDNDSNLYANYLDKVKIQWSQKKSFSFGMTDEVSPLEKD